MTTDGLIPTQTIASMVAAYEASKAQIEEAFNLMDQASTGMKGAFGDKVLYAVDRVFPDDMRREKAITLLLVGAWTYVVNQTGVRNVMTQERTDELKEQLDNADLPPFTVENIQAMLNQLRGDLGTLMEESVKEVFEWLRPRRSGYKTNTEFEVGQKAILSNVFDIWQYRDSYNISVDEQNAMLTGLDNVFHLLDGKGVARYPGDLKTLVKEAVKKKEWECETEYFQCKWYKKGSFHLKFKRMDLVAQMNQIAGGARLKPAEAC